MAADPDPDEYSMSFGDHLEELRRRILWSLAAPLPISVITFLFSDPIIEWLYLPLDRVLKDFDLPRRLQVLGPAEMLVTKIKLSLIFALVLSAPWIFWQAWLFVRPGLYRHEQRFVRFLVPGSAVLTATGVSLLYFVMLPLMLQVLVMFGASLAPGSPEQIRDPRIRALLAGQPTVEVRTAHPETLGPGQVYLKWPERELYGVVPRDDVSPEPGNGLASQPPLEIVRIPDARGSMISQEFRLTTYINFVLLLMLGIVIAFQMPLVILLLGWLGLVSAGQLRSKRKYAVFICAIVAAVITPADALSMIMMLIPLIALYELSIVLLVLAPASAVAEGTLAQRLRRFPKRER